MGCEIFEDFYSGAVVVFQRTSWGRGGKFSEYLRRSQIFVEYMCFS